MGALKLPGWLKRRVVTKELNKLEEEQPMIRKALAWLTDPAATGRKRSIALGCALISGACRGIDEALEGACAAATIAGDSAWCRVNPEAWATVIDTVNAAVQVIQPGMDLATAAFALVGFIHARRKAKASTNGQNGPIHLFTR